MLITRVRKVESLRCLAGLMLMLLLSVRLLERWAGWELKYIPLRKLFGVTNGPSKENSTPGGSTINLFLTD
jgi:hypothetical protein